MKISIENKIRFNVIVIYFIVALICAALLYYVFNLRDSIDRQKESIDFDYSELSSTEEFIRTVNTAQNEASLYISTKRYSHLVNFRDNLRELERQIDSLIIIEGDHSRDSLLLEVRHLLSEKGTIVSQLNQQFNMRELGDPVSEKLLSVEPTIMTDTVIITTTTIRDTVINTVVPEDTRSRRQRRREPLQADTVVTVTTFMYDTVFVEKADNSSIVSEFTEIAQKASESYLKRIAAIEQNVNRLILADHELSARISDLVIKLYGQVLQSNLERVERGERHVKYLNNFSIAGAMIVLGLILIFTVLIINDVNKGRAARTALEKANSRIKDTMESRHKLLLSVSHDIKTPLSSILGYLEMPGPDGGIAAEDIGSMRTSGKHILSLLENLLEFSSLEQGTLQASQRTFSLYEIYAEIIELIAPLCKRKKLEFLTSADFDPTTNVISDDLKIKQIALNLLSNAVKYTTEGSVSFTLAYSDGMLCILVSDTGAGIPKEKIHTIYKPFTRVESNNSLAKGSGFGMYVVKGMVDLLKGSIRIDSEVGTGTTVKVSLPAETVMREPERILQPDNRRVLVVDDDETLLLVIEKMLTELGCEAVTCSGPECFADKLKEVTGIYMIVTDMEMGDFSGNEALAFSHEYAPGVPVILMTGRGDITEDSVCKAGFAGYLSKPVTKQTLRELLSIDTEIISDQNASPEEPAMSRFAMLKEFLGDEDAVKEVLSVFVVNTGENINLLQVAMAEDNFGQARAICHKMLPMFVQTEAHPDLIRILREMDSSQHRNQKGGYANWKVDISLLIDRSGEYMEEIESYIRDRGN